MQWNPPCNRYTLFEIPILMMRFVVFLLGSCFIAGSLPCDRKLLPEDVIQWSGKNHRRLGRGWLNFNIKLHKPIISQTKLLFSLKPNPKFHLQVFGMVL